MVRPQQGARAVLIAVAGLGLGLVPATAAAQEAIPAEEEVDWQVPDALGNLGNVGTGAVFDPQTPQDIVDGGGTTRVDGIEPITITAEELPNTSMLKVVRGPLLHGEGDLMLLWLDDRPGVVRLPEGSPLTASGIEPGSLVAAICPPSDSGIPDAWRVTIWPNGTSLVP